MILTASDVKFQWMSIMRKVIITAIFVFLTNSVAYAQGFIGQLFCNANISSEIRGSVSGKASFSVGFLDIEIMNNSSEYRITSMTIGFEGSYNGRKFVRRYDDRTVTVEPGTSNRLIFQTGIPGSYSDIVVVDEISFVDYFGCRD